MLHLDAKIWKMKGMGITKSGLGEHDLFFIFYRVGSQRRLGVFPVVNGFESSSLSDEFLKSHASVRGRSRPVGID